MEIDYAYIKNLLEKLKSNETVFLRADILLEKMEQDKTSSLDKFHYHILLLFDTEIIEKNTLEEYFYFCGEDDDDSGSVIYNDETTSIRLTMNGHKFIEVLNNNQIVDKIKVMGAGAIKIGINLGIEAAKQYLFKS